MVARYRTFFTCPTVKLLLFHPLFLPGLDPANRMHRKSPLLSILRAQPSNDIRPSPKKRLLRRLIVSACASLLTSLSPNLAYAEKDMRLLLMEWDLKFLN
jgi:hypothetical protein